MSPRPALRRARAINLIVATIALAAPASAYALGSAASAQPAPAAVPAPQSQGAPSLRATPRQLRAGQELRLAGRAPAADAGRRVLLERQPAAVVPGGQTARWRTVASARVGRDGRFSFRLEPRRSASYRAVIAGAPVALLASSDGSLRVTVGARFRIAARWLDLLGGGPVSVRGRLAPAQAGRLVVLERRTGRRWRAIAARRTGRDGRFWVRWRAGGRLPARLRLVFAGDGANGSATLPLGTALLLRPSVASWYYDGGATACGFHATYGVANRALPCGTHVTMRRGGRVVTAVVDDRGPYVWGRSWDLNQNTAAALGFSGVGTVWVGR